MLTPSARMYSVLVLVSLLLQLGGSVAAAEAGGNITSDAAVTPAPLQPPKAAAAQAAPPAVTRFFIDEGYFLEGDTEILRAYITASKGRMTVSGESTAAFLSVKGYYSPDTWDVYWTIRQACHMAYKHMQPHQKVNCIPGVAAMSLKRTFASTWQQAYGELAFNYIPRSYLIPEQYWLWRNYLLTSASPQDRKWVLKANIHRGKGVSVVSQHEALSHALTHSREAFSTSGSSSSSEGVQYLNVLVQSYLQQQLVIAGRSSYIRVWLLVTSINPLRAYLFDGGFAIFGKQKGAAAGAAAGNKAPPSSSSSSSSSSTDDLIVNLWIQDRNSSPIWSLQHLQDYLKAHPEAVSPLPAPQQQQPSSGRHLLHPNSSSSSSSTQQRRTFADARADMQTSASLVLAAALPAMRAAASESGAPQQGPFEYFGLDFVFDAYLRPWMLEVNAIPSLARRKKSECSGEKATADCKLTTASSSSSSSSEGASSKGVLSDAVSDDFDAQKEQFVHDMLVLLGLPVDANSSTAAAADSADAAALLHNAAAAAAAAGIRSPAPGADKVNSSSSSSSSSASNSTADRRLLSFSGSIRQQQRSWRQLLQHTTHTHHRHSVSKSSTQRSKHQRSSEPATTTSSSSSSNSSSEQQGYKGVSGLQWSGPAPALTQLPQQLQKLFCPAGSSSSSSSGGGTEYACIKCLTADDLAALAAAEGELQRAGKFVPVHDLITAHSVNAQALKDATSASGTGTASSTSSSPSGSTSVPPAGPAGGTAAAAGLATAVPTGKVVSTEGDMYLSQSPSVWQKLYNAWKGMSQGHVGMRDLAVMKYYTKESKVYAQKGLGLQRQDYVMSAWLRVRREERCERVGSFECVLKRLKLLVGKCYL